MRRLLTTTALTILCCCAPILRAQQVLSLAGAWDLSLGDSTHYDDYVVLPGSMLTNGKGRPVSVTTPWTGSLYDSSYYFNPYMERYRVEGQMKFPFFLTPERHYVGTAWYRRRVYVPQEWKGQHITLLLERPHIETTVFVNGVEVGHQMSLSVPHRYDLSKVIRTGESNEIAIRVYNGIENVCVGQDSHSVSDQTQGNWNGIVGRLELQAQWKRLFIRQVRMHPDSVRIGEGRKAPWQKTLHVTVDLENHLNELRVLWDYNAFLTVRTYSDGQPGKVLRSLVQPVRGDQVAFDIILGDSFRQWDEFEPYLYLMTLEVGDDVYETTFGLRDISIRGRQFYINGRPLFLRGTVESCCFPLTGYPPTDKAEWLRIFRQCRRYGLNHMRFHSYCPPEAAFQAADETGMYLQPEGPSWPNHGVKLRRGMAIDQYLLDESRRIVDEYGHHPSFVMMAAGNEPAGDWVSYCDDWVRQMHAYDSTRVYCGASVGGGWAWDGGSEYHVKGGARGLDWDRHAPSSDDDYFSQIEFPRNYKPQASSHAQDTSSHASRLTPNNTPIIAHEQGQWCAFPDFGEIPQYTGAYKPGNFEIFRDLLRDNGMAAMAGKFLEASGRLQTLCYKYEIERNLRTPDYAGFQLLGLNDYSGQGTALVGPLNVFWHEKGYCTADQWRQFCSILVPLAQFPRFVYSRGDTLRVPVSVYNAFKTAIGDVRTTYYVTTADSDSVVCGGQFPAATIPIGKSSLGTIVLPLDSIDAPAKFTLTVRFSDYWKNHWDFWVYPDTRQTSSSDSLRYLAPRTSHLAPRTSPHVTSDYRDALAALKRGETVLLEAAGQVTLGSDVKQTYLPVFWNTSWFKMRPPHTTGAYIDAAHPLFRHGFPTDTWANLNWWELLNRAQVMNLRELPADYQSPVQPIDTWHVSRKLGMIVEARVGEGRLLMTTMDISSDLDHRLVARQMRHALLSYIASPDFQPSLQLQPDVVEHFFTRQAPPVNMFTNDSPDELKPKLQ